MASHNTPRSATTIPKTELEEQQEQAQITEYRNLVDLVEQKINEREYTLEVLAVISKLLIQNPEYYTIWNARRRLLMHGFFSEQSHTSPSSTESSTSSQPPTGASAEKSSSSSTTTSTASTTTQQNPESQQNLGKSGAILDLIQSDLEFLFPLLMKNPKCYWIWNYRLWLLEQSKLRLPAQTSRKLWLGELGLVGKMLIKDSRNFHGWGYRRKVVSELESPELEGSSMVESEFEYTRKMLSSSKDGLKNFSAWHHRSKLIPRLLDEREADDAAREQFLDNEFDFVITAIYTDSHPYDQSPWFYLQFLMTTLTNPIGHATIVPNFTHTDRTSYVTRQLQNLREFMDGGEDCKWVYNALIEYTMALAEMEERKLEDDERQDCMTWLGELRKLDPLRRGRWDDVEVELVRGPLV